MWRVRGEPLVAATGSGPLDGARVAVKDLLAVAGHRVGAGNPTWLAGAPAEPTHAPAVATLLAAGASIAGIARCDELAWSLAGQNPWYGTPPNPAAPGRIPGGSSSGSAVAVALGQADIGLATDTAGSVRVPASYLGLHGLRPSHGAVPTEGVLALAPSFDTVGWLSRDAATLRAVGDVLLPADTAAPPTRWFVPESLLAVADEPLRAPLLAASRDAELAAGPTREQLEIWAAAFRTVQAHEAWAAHGAWVRDHPSALGADVGSRFAAAVHVPDTATVTARGVLARAREELLALVDGAVLVLPATPTRPPLPTDTVADVRARTLLLTCLASLAGLPCIVVPVPDAGVGLALVGSPGSDRALLRLAAPAIQG